MSELEYVKITAKSCVASPFNSPYDKKLSQMILVLIAVAEAARDRFNHEGECNCGPSDTCIQCHEKGVKLSEALARLPQ